MDLHFRPSWFTGNKQFLKIELLKPFTSEILVTISDRKRNKQYLATRRTNFF